MISDAGGDPSCPSPDATGKVGGDRSSVEEERITSRYGYSREQFLRRLSVSGEAAIRVRTFFEKHGVRVELPPSRLRESLEQIREFAEHEADILIAGTPFSIEVKGRPNLIFRDARDFPYRDVSVDTVSGYRAKLRKPLAYVMVSGDLEGGLVLPTFTERHWRIERKRDRERNLHDDFYFAAKAHFVGRRGWLISLCRALQAREDLSFDSVLVEFGYDPLQVRALHGQ